MRGKILGKKGPLLILVKNPKKNTPGKLGKILGIILDTKPILYQMHTPSMMVTGEGLKRKTPWSPIQQSQSRVVQTREKTTDDY